MAVLAPIAIASVVIATRARSGLLSSTRKANRMRCRRCTNAIVRRLGIGQRRSGLWHWNCYEFVGSGWLENNISEKKATNFSERSSVRADLWCRGNLLLTEIFLRER